MGPGSCHSDKKLSGQNANGSTGERSLERPSEHTDNDDNVNIMEKYDDDDNDNDKADDDDDAIDLAFTRACG